MVSMKTLPKMTMTCDTSPSVCDDVDVYVCVSTSAQQRSLVVFFDLERTLYLTLHAHIILVVDTQRRR